MQMANPSKVVSGLFELPATYDPTTAGDRLRARLQRKKELTAEFGAAAANTQLAAEAQNEADHIASRITPKVQALATENQLLRNTAQQVSTLSGSSTQGGAVNSSPSPPLASGPQEEVALGQARMAQYYTETADDVRGTAQWWGPFIIILTGLTALLWNWYNRKAYEEPGLSPPPGAPDLSRTAWWKTLGIFFALFLASLFPIEVMQLPRAAISPLVKLVSP